MASRITLQVSRHVLRGSRCMPVRLLSTFTTPSTKFISTQRNRSLFQITQQSASCLHTSSVLSSMHIVTIQDEKDFDTRVINNEKPVLVDFFATYVTFLVVRCLSPSSCRILCLTYCINTHILSHTNTAESC